MSNCVKCVGGLQNTGLVFKSKAPQVAKKVLFMPLSADDGTANGIDVSGTTAIDLTTYVNQAEASKRIYPTFGILEQLTDEREEAIKQSFDSGNVAYVRDGNLPIQFMLPNVPPSYKAKLDAVGCKKVGFFYVDNCGCVVGGKVVGDLLLPIPIMDYSFDSRFVRAGYETVGMLEINFLVDNKFNDADLTMIECEELTGDALRLEGLINLDGVVTDVDFTPDDDAVLTLELTTDYGSARKKQPITGIKAADLELEMTSGALTIDAVVETSPGVYLVDVTGTSITGFEGFFKLASSVKGFDQALLNANSTFEIA